jgi:ferredoxin-NADP reductase
MASSYFKLRVKEIKVEQRDFRIFTFDETKDFNYKAGQYITLIHSVSGNEVRRSYSMTTSPGIDELISIGVKRIPNGFYSRLLIDYTRVGDELLTSGAGGLFVIPGEIEKYKQLFFFAAGSGITPIFSIIKFALHFHPWLKVVLIYSAGSPATTILLEELQLLQVQFRERFTIQWLFSSSPDLSGARLYRESLIHFVKYFSIALLPEMLFYVCGPISYMRMCTFVLMEMGVPPNNIKKENFLIAQARPSITPPPDKQSHTAYINFKGEQVQVPVHYPDSILQAARKQGISLPYSCETGRCANCIARRKKGDVWLSHNEVLTDADLAQGLTLTCVGHPLGGDVELIIE